MTEQAVIVHFRYGSKDLKPLFELEDKLEKAISEAKVGDFDGDEINVDGSDGFLYMYGDDADKLFSVVEPILKKNKFMEGAEVKKRYGPPEEGVSEVSLKITL